MLSRFLLSKPAMFKLIYSQRFFGTGYGGYGSGDKISWTQQIEEGETKNPFYNPAAAGIKKEMTIMQESIKQWQAEFKTKHGRKPTLDEMRKDPTVGPTINSIEKQKNALKSTVQRFRIN